MEDNNLDTLKILFIVKGVISVISTLFVGFIVLGVGSFAASEVVQADLNEADMPFNPIAIISALGTIAFLLSLAFTVLTFLAAKYIGERRNHTFIVVVAVFNILSGILGLALGIFALIELHRMNVKPLFGRGIPNNML